MGNVSTKETKGSSLFTLKSQCESCGMRHSWQNESKMSGQEVSRGDVELTSTMLLTYVNPCTYIELVETFTLSR